MRRLVTPFRLAFGAVVVLLVTAFVLWLVPSNSYIFLPDRAHPVESLVKVDAPRAKPDKGGIYFVDIFVRKASLIERLWPGIHEGAELIPKSALLAPGVSDKQRQTADQ